MAEAVIKRKRIFRFSVSQAVINAIILALLFMVVYPLFLMLLRSVKDGVQEIHNPLTLTFPMHFTTYKFAWLLVRGLILNSFIVAFSITFGILAVCTITAYGFTMFKFPGKNVLFMMILALMMVPGILTLIPSYALVNSFGLIDSRFGVILPGIAGGIPFGTFLLRTFFSGLPKDLFDAADIDGASHIRRCLTLTIPLSMPIIFTLGLNTFIGAWNDLIWPSIILLDSKLHTIPIGLVAMTEDYATKNIGMGTPIAGYVIVSIPLIFLFALTSKQFVKGLTSGAFKM